MDTHTAVADTVIADFDFNYFGYAPTYPSGIMILKTAAGYDVARREYITGIGYRHLTFARFATEGDARAAANDEYKIITTELRAVAVAKDIRTREILASLNVTPTLSRVA